jgi:hypothetical protein
MAVVADNLFNLKTLSKGVSFLFSPPAPTGLLIVATTAMSRGELLF